MRYRAETIPCCSNDDVDARLHGKNSAVENNVIQPRIVLVDIKEHSGVRIACPVNFSLTLPGALLVDALSDYLSNPCFNWAVKTHT